MTDTTTDTADAAGTPRGQTRRGISVVVPVKGRVELMGRLLESLATAVSRCTEPAEVIVVDDSPQPEADRHRENCRRHGARYVEGPAHVGTKRNFGTRLAQYDLVCFVDSDCRADPELLDRHVKALRDAPPQVAAIAGPGILAEGDTAVFRVMRRSWLLNGHHEDPVRYERLTSGATCNLAVRREVFEKVGGFPEDSPHPTGGEDIELGLRLTAGGYVTACEAGAVVLHDSVGTDTLGAVCRRLLSYGLSEQWLSVTHPERRRFMLNKISVVAAASLAALAARRRSRGRSLLAVPAVAGLLLARQVGPLLGDDRTPRALADSVACALLEWLFDAGAVAGAVRYRSPALLFGGFEWPDDSTYLRSEEK
ncbi:glycosyltransferase [Streptomyces sp. TRM 70361]|uniref:glycosyltransferase family 2 protein n=1 Tax=Streptomyces sp. TRM 70361 TaxID=3116553 RepID=UPI002E7B29BB|nr:glycosyltransferase [Streptomyces sp. TRM 70361]MEE1942763.1 glycosyltransferase [Streptomyces sp. TRM 70361]